MVAMGHPGRIWRAWRVGVLPLIALGCAFLLLGVRPDLEIDSAKYTALGHWSLQRLAAGDPMWWSPALGEAPYFKKPPLGLWWAGLFAWAGPPTPWVVRLSQCVALGAMVLLTTAAGARLLGRRAALLAGLALVLTPEVLASLDSVVLDYLMSALLMVAVCMGVRARHAHSTGAACGWMVLVGVPIGLGMLTKPFVPVVAIPLLAAWIACCRRPDRLRVSLCAFPALCVAITLAAPWHLAMWHAHGSAFLDEYLGHQTIARGTGRAFGSGPPWFYLARIATTYWPWLAVLAAAAWMHLRSGRRTMSRDAALLCGIWILGWLVLASVFADKRGRYIMPVYPMLAWICGAWLAHQAPRMLRMSVRRWLEPTIILAALMLGATTIAVGAVLGPPRTEWEALGEYLRHHSDRPVYTGFLIDNQRSKVYLQTGRWPALAEGDPPTGALVVFAPRSRRVAIPEDLDPAPHAIVFHTAQRAETGVVVLEWNAGESR